MRGSAIPVAGGASEKLFGTLASVVFWPRRRIVTEGVTRAESGRRSSRVQTTLDDGITRRAHEYPSDSALKSEQTRW